MFVYIDDFVIVSNVDDAGCHCQALPNLLEELGLSMNPDKR